MHPESSAGNDPYSGEQASAEVTADLAAVALRESEDAVLSLDPNGFVTSWNPAAARLLGYDAATVIGQSADRLMAAESLAQHRVRLATALAGEHVLRAPVRARHRNGTPVLLSVTMVPMGHGSGVAVIARDISERQLAQAALAESEQRLLEAQRLAHIGLWLWDAGLGTVQLSYELHRIHGIDPLEFDGSLSSYLMLIHPDDRAGLEAALSQAFSTQTSLEREYRIVRPDRSTRWTHLIASLELSASGAPTGLRGICQDITERTLEIRTPMNGVIGLTQLLKDTELDDVQERYVDGVQGAGQALLLIIDDILDFSKLEAERVVLEDVEFSPRALVEEIAQLLSSTAEAKNLSIVAACAPGMPATLRGDPWRLRQMLLNLASNAVKFTSSGSVTLSVAAASEVPSPTGTVLARFTVEDTGIGIDPALHDSLFEPFSQADASTTRRYGGTGLGLAICHRLVRAMGGWIEVESAPGSGSTFSFTIELSAHPGTADATTPHGKEAVGTTAWPMTGPPPSGALADGRGLVLIVEDNPVNQLVAKGMLRRLGFSCEIVGDGRQALAALDARSYDAVLMDCHMPELDGFEATVELRRREADRLATGRNHCRPRTPVIAMTAGVLPADRERCMAVGMDDFLAKPIDIDLLDSLLRQYVSGSTHNARV